MTPAMFRSESMEASEIRQELTPAIFLFMGARAHTSLLGEEVSLMPGGFMLTGPVLYANGQQSSAGELLPDSTLSMCEVPSQESQRRRRPSSTASSRSRGILHRIRRMTAARIRLFDTAWALWLSA